MKRLSRWLGTGPAKFGIGLFVTCCLVQVAPAAAGHLSLQLQDVQYDLAAGTSTWSYVVVGNQRPALSHATLELGTCAQIVSCSPGPCGPVVNDPTTGVTGIKWDTGGSFFQLTVDGLYAAAPVTYGIKAGRHAYTAITTGPSPTCDQLECQQDAECDNGDVCDGIETCVDFQCQDGSPLDPDDGNACTEDACDPTTGVSNTVIDPNDGNACTNDSCDPDNGVINDPIDPNDGNACTNDSCDPDNGVINDPIDPNDGNACTNDSCDPDNGVINDPIDPNDGNACTNDSCDPDNGVINDPIDPNDGNACTNDSCDPDNGVINDPIDPDDGNACTNDSCDPDNGVINDPIDPNDGNACTNDSCDPDNGVINDPIDPNDGNACTDDSCDPDSGVINDPVDPDDGNACTDDSCDPDNGVINDPVDPDDGNACTDDSCDPDSGVINDPVDPDDGNACTDDSCDPDTGVINDPVDPDDGNACTDDSCDPDTGVINDPVDPDDGVPCTDDSCDPATGVSNTPNDTFCDDGDVCTTDVCDPDSNQADGCVVTCDPSNDESECFVEIGDRIWNDLDRDGVQDDGEPGIGGVQLDVRYCDDGSLDMPTTAFDGSYSYWRATCDLNESLEVGVKPGNFLMGGALFGGIESPASQGPDDLDSNCEGGVSDCLLIGRGETDADVDCGYSFGSVQLTPTGTECSNFVFGVPIPAQDQDFLSYTLKKGKIRSVTPGAYILWTEVDLEAGSNSVMVLQMTDQDPDYNLVSVASDGAKVWDGFCNRLGTVTTVASNGDVELIVEAPMAGTYYLSVKYNASSLSDSPNPGGDVEYTYVTMVNGGAFTADSLILTKRK